MYINNDSIQQNTVLLAAALPAITRSLSETDVYSVKTDC